MAAITSTWLIGSQENMTSASWELNATEYTFNSGDWYLTHGTPAISLLDEAIDHMTTEGLTNPGVEILQNRRIRIFSDDAFTIDWNSTFLRGLFGFTANSASATSHTSGQISRLLFSPGYPALFATDDDQSSYPMEDTLIQVSADGIVDTDTHNTLLYNELKWTDVMRSRMRIKDGANQNTRFGTWHDFRELVLVSNFRFQVYETVTEDSASSSAASLGAAMGTYQLREQIRGRYDRVARTAGTRWDIPELKVIEVVEYT